MGRKSLATERIEQILDAFEACIVQHGLEKATLQRTATQAKLNIGMIHHYIGNRDDLLRAMVDRFAKREKEEMALFVKSTPVTERLPYLLNAFLGDNGATRSDRIISELVAASPHNPLIQGLLVKINQVYEEMLASEIAQLYPQATPDDCHRVAFSILALTYGSDLLIDLGFEQQRKALALQSAEVLLQTLANK